MMRTLDQDLLRWAHASVQEVVGQQDDKKDKYRTAVKGAPAFIQGCGLAQAYAFWHAKTSGNGAEAYGYQQLINHLDAAPGLSRMREKIMGTAVADYVFLTTRTQAALVFLKRMTDAYLPRQEE